MSLSVSEAQYLRAVFMAYWQDAAPSAEVFYIKASGIDPTPGAISELEQTVLDLATHADATNRLIRMVYLSHGPIELNADDIAMAGWRVVGDED